LKGHQDDTSKQECLDHFIIFGTQHMDALCREYLDHYLTERPHQGKENEVLVGESPAKQENAEMPTLSDIRCQTRLGGLLKSYSRQAA
jgi:putative transposase